jgi:DNA-binding transcriptional regulator LsrR (DeoR family)
VINVEEWAEIRRLHWAEGMGVKAIVRRLGVARNTVRSARAVARVVATTAGVPRVDSNDDPESETDIR